MSLSDERLLIPEAKGPSKYWYEEEKVKEFIKIIEEIVTRKCMGTSANCYEIKKEIREKAGEKLVEDEKSSIHKWRYHPLH